MAFAAAAAAALSVMQLDSDLIRHGLSCGLVARLTGAPEESFIGQLFLHRNGLFSVRTEGRGDSALWWFHTLRS